MNENIFICNICNKEFDYKSLLTKHLNRKTPCDKVTLTNKIINTNDNIIENNYDIKTEYNNSIININKLIKKSTDKECGFCNSKFANRSNVLKHLKKSCKEKQRLEQERDKLKFAYDLFIEQSKKSALHKEIEKIINNKPDINKNITNNNITNNTNNNITNNTNNNTNNITNNTNNLTLQIQINSFGEEDLSHITLDDYKKCLEQRFPGLFEYIRLVHLNKKAPQNHNVLLTNGKNKYIKIFKNGKFRTEYKHDIIEDILNNNMGRLEDKARELEGKVNTKIIDNHNEFKKVYYKNDKAVIKRNMEKVEFMLLDDKDIIEDTHNKEITY